MKAALISAALALLAGAAIADQPQAERTAAVETAPAYQVLHADASVPFASTRVNGFQVGDDRSLIFRIGVNRYYRAVVWQPCKSDLKWTNHIGFDASPTNTLDRFSHVIVRGHRCPLESLDEIARPEHTPQVRDAQEEAPAATQAN